MEAFFNFLAGIGQVRDFVGEEKIFNRMVVRENAGRIVAADFGGQAVGFAHVSRWPLYWRAGREQDRLRDAHVNLMTKEISVASVGIIQMLMDVDYGVRHWIRDYN